MEPRLLLVATNLAVPWLAPVVKSLVRDCASFAVVTTAEPKLKERARNALLAHEALRAAGGARVEYFDLDFPAGGINHSQAEPLKIQFPFSRSTIQGIENMAAHRACRTW